MHNFLSFSLYIWISKTDRLHNTVTGTAKNECGFTALLPIVDFHGTGMQSINVSADLGLLTWRSALAKSRQKWWATTSSRRYSLPWPSSHLKKTKLKFYFISGTCTEQLLTSSVAEPPMFAAPGLFILEAPGGKESILNTGMFHTSIIKLVIHQIEVQTC